MPPEHDKLKEGRMDRQATPQRQQQQQQHQEQQQKQQRQQEQKGLSVFVSHSHRDNDIVRKIAHDLSEQGVQVWLDEDQIAPGELWTDKLTQAIAESQAVIVVLSKNTEQSKSQTSEIALALSAQQRDSSKKLIPVRVDREAHVPFFLKDRVYCDLASEEVYARNFKQLLTALKAPSPTTSANDSKEARIAAIAAEKQLLQREMEALEKRKSSLTTALLGTLVGGVAASGSVIAGLVIAGLVQGVRWEFVVGLLSGIIASVISAMGYDRFRRKTYGKGVGNARR